MFYSGKSKYGLTYCCSPSETAYAGKPYACAEQLVQNTCDDIKIITKNSKSYLCRGNIRPVILFFSKCEKQQPSLPR